jgi:tetratricopeptide (TPR) repeat protein
MRSMQKKLIICLVMLFSACSFISARAAEPPLSADAQQALNKGLEAAKLQDWELAISYFTQAQKIAERNPRILYSLGLAHARAGHGPAGTAWLRAYLAAAPTAPDASEVEKEIVGLENKAEDAISKIFGLSIAVSAKDQSIEHKQTALQCTFQWQAEAGDFKGAQQTKNELMALWQFLSPDERSRLNIFMESLLWEQHIRYLTSVSELQSIPEALPHVVDTFIRTEALAFVMEEQARIGDIAGAEKTILHLEECIDSIQEEDIPDYKAELGKVYGYSSAKYLVAEGQSTNALRLYALRKLASCYAVIGHVNDWRRVLDKAGKIVSENKLDDNHFHIGDDLKQYPVSLEHHPPLVVTNPVKAWCDLASSLSGNADAIDLEGELKRAGGSPEGNANPYGIAADLAIVAVGHAKCLRDIRRLDADLKRLQK